MTLEAFDQILYHRYKLIPSRIENKTTPEVVLEKTTKRIDDGPNQQVYRIYLPFSFPADPNTLGNQKGFRSLLLTFPDVQTIVFDGFFLIFHASQPPKRPWPRCIASLHPYVTSDPDDHGPIHKLTRLKSDSDIALLVKSNVRNNVQSFREQRHRLATSLESLGVPVSEISYWHNFIILVLRNVDQDVRLVPVAFGCCPVYYVFEKSLGIPNVVVSGNDHSHHSSRRDSPPCAWTWLRSNEQSQDRWIEARWVWSGISDRDSPQDLMRGWRLCCGPHELHKLLHNHG